jgi:VCBS repeat-containing protein
MKRPEKSLARYSIASLSRAIFRRGRGFIGRVLELPARLLRYFGVASQRTWQQRHTCRPGFEALEPRYVLSATVSTDKPAYAPGETAAVAAIGFQPGESVDLQVVRSDGTTYAPVAIVDDAQGDLQTTWVLPDDSPGYTFRLTATGETSGEVAQASFGGLTTWVEALPTDYAPGQTANILAGGFQVGEAVDFQVTNLTNGHVYSGWSVTDGSAGDGDGATDGHIQTGWLVPGDAANSLLQLTATGETSALTAQNTFTDTTSFVALVVGSQSGTPTAGTAGTATYNVSVGFSSNGSGSDTVTLSFAWQGTTPAGVSTSFAPGSVTGTSSGAQSSTLSLTTGTSTAAGSYHFKVTGTDGTATISDTSGTLVVGTAAPTITSLSPASATEGGAPFTLTVNGTGFTASSVVQWNGAALATTWVSATQLTATVPAADLAEDGTASVTVLTPPGGPSNAKTFTITEVAPAVSNNGNVGGAEFSGVSNTGSFSDIDDPVTISVQSGGGSVTQSGTTSGTWTWSGAAPEDGVPTTVVIRATNNEGASSTTSFTVSGTEVPPTVSNNGNVSAAELLTASNTGSFSDIDDPVTISVQSGGGSVTQTGTTSGTWTWTGIAPEDGSPDTVVIKATNSEGATATTSFTVSGTEVAPSFTASDPPAVNENAGPQTVSTWATFLPDVPTESSETPAYHVLGVGNPALFAVALQVAADGTLTYTPAADVYGSSTFTVDVQDSGDAGNDTSAPQTFTITVNFVNHAPSFTKGPDQNVLENSGPQTVVNWATNISAGPPSEAWETLSFLVSNDNPALFTTQPSISNGGTLTYTPAANAYGSTTVSVRLQDNGGTANGGQDTSAPQSFTLTMNHPPVASDDAYTLRGASLSVAAPGVLGNDSDPDGDSLTAVLASGPSHGSLTLNGDGSFTYTPDTTFTGTEVFTYRASDGVGDSLATVTITGHAPVAADDSFDVPAGEPLVVDAPGVLESATDADGGTLTALLVGGPSHGSLTLNSDGSFSYAPDQTFTGGDSFTYRVSDGFFSSGTATVTLIGHPPVAVDDSAQTYADAPVTIPVLANDSDPDGSTLAVADVTDGQLGMVEGNWLSDTVTYTPNQGVSGLDHFHYTVENSLGYTAQATVTVQVLPVSDLIAAGADSYTVAENAPLHVTAADGVLANDSAPDGAPLQAVLVEDVSNGTLTLAADGSFDYTPTPDWNGVDTFVYRAFDGTSYSHAVTVTLTVTAPDEPPVAQDVGADGSLTTYAGVPVAVDVLADDSTADGAPPLLSSFTDGQGGTVTREDGTDRLVYTPNAGFSGADHFTYTISDDRGQTATATVFVQVLPVSDSVQVAPDSYTLNEDSPLAVAAAQGVLANDGPGALRAVLVTTTTKGDLSLQPDGSFSYQPYPKANGTDSFLYRAYDSASGLYSLLTTVTLRITPAQDAPVLNPDGPYVTEDRRLEVDLNVGETVTLAPGDIAFDPDCNPIWFVTDATPPDPALTLTTSALTFTGLTPGDDPVTVLIKDAQNGLADGFTVVFRVVAASLPKMDISGHYDLFLSPYGTAAGQDPPPLARKTVKPNFGALTLAGDASVAAAYTDSVNPVTPFGDDTVFVLNYRAEIPSAGDTVTLRGIAFDVDNQMGNGNEAFFQFDGTPSPLAVPARYMDRVQRQDGSYDVVLHLGKYYKEQLQKPVPTFTRIAFINRVTGPHAGSVTFRDLFQVTESTIPPFLP